MTARRRPRKGQKGRRRDLSPSPLARSAPGAGGGVGPRPCEGCLTRARFPTNVGHALCELWYRAIARQAVLPCLRSTCDAYLSELRAEVEAGFRFCPDCGFEIAAEGVAAGSGRFRRASASPAACLPGWRDKIRASRRAIEGERKQVTVLFCDLAGSTAVADHLDPEEYRELLDHYTALAMHEIYRFEGIVNQLAGDGVMALFGAPIAHEDAPQRAVWAALAIRDALAQFNDELKRRARLRAAGAHRHPHRTGGRRHGRQRSEDGLHGDRRHHQPRRPARVARPAGHGPDQRGHRAPGARLLRDAPGRAAGREGQGRAGRRLRGDRRSAARRARWRSPRRAA